MCRSKREELDISVVEDKIVDFFRGFEKEQKVSSIYLTGPGFDRKNISENIVKSINSRGVRIFAGQNLFVKGHVLWQQPVYCLHIILLADPVT